MSFSPPESELEMYGVYNKLADLTIAKLMIECEKPAKDFSLEKAEFLYKVVQQSLAAAVTIAIALSDRQERSPCEQDHPPQSVWPIPADSAVAEPSELPASSSEPIFPDDASDIL
jgi:hypothetical protein